MLKILFLADTHIGFDDPQRKRIIRRRRGNEFWENYVQALKPAFEGEVDAVIHGGDLLFRSKVSSGLVSKAFAPLVQLAEKGTPVFVVPGNHERGYFNLTMFEYHPNLHIFDKPRTFIKQINGARLALSGFPFVREDIRRNFLTTLNQTKWQEQSADIHLLCLHQNVDGASVGPANYVFRNRPDTIQIIEIPHCFNATLCGHIHRQQTLTKDLAGQQLSAPVIYPGSTERTSFAEKDEDKGYVILCFEESNAGKFHLADHQFKPVNSRPMFQFELNLSGWDGEKFSAWLKDMIDSVPVHSLVRIRIKGKIAYPLKQALRVKTLRSICPQEMNVYLQYLPEQKN